MLCHRDVSRYSAGLRSWLESDDLHGLVTAWTLPVYRVLGLGAGETELRESGL